MGILHEIYVCFLPTHEAFLFMWVLAAIGVVAGAITLERFFAVNRRTDYNAAALFERLKKLIDEKKVDEAVQVCKSGGHRALPRVLGAGIKKSQQVVQLVESAIAEEYTHMSSALERRLNLLVMFGNAATLMGLLGTVFGLIMSFAAVGRPDVAAVEKSALLAVGISAAMNSTLVGLTISIPCVLAFALLRARVDQALTELDRYSVAILKLLVPPDIIQRGRRESVRSRGDEEEAADTDVTPMLNIMVMLIPLLLTSSEFVKIGSIELKLPESSAAGGGSGGGKAAEEQQTKLDLGIVITSKGFTLYHYFKQEAAADGASMADAPAQIPRNNDEYNYAALNKALAQVKQQALATIIRSYYPEIPESATLFQLAQAYAKRDFSANKVMADFEDVKIVAEGKIEYQVVVSVMDAARGTHTADGMVTMFPNVSIAGGIIQ